MTEFCVAEQSDKYAVDSFENDKDDEFMKSVNVLVCTFLLLKWHTRVGGQLGILSAAAEESESFSGIEGTVTVSVSNEAFRSLQAVLVMLLLYGTQQHECGSFERGEGRKSSKRARSIQRKSE